MPTAFPTEISYSEKYNDDCYEYRHVILPKEIAYRVVQLTRGGSRLLEEKEWRGLGVQGSQGWAHYEYHKPEMHVLLLRRPLVPEEQGERAA
eukprot:CAMPEP_0115083976 /NCGR_PEP_ID=MMETSP0227-20121206/20947_1 /TAXON_ID=89957 /ORGANISM="Polarella glacialis, Strain CCMP 1383" /LENGTH=91 /DNA_ID=CAMNT_0002472619 /DNA_START=234 /DNA_END=509 /DNA_ORIENTATION=+